jgi:hypothetical protein
MRKWRYQDPGTFDVWDCSTEVQSASKAPQNDYSEQTFEQNSALWRFFNKDRPAKGYANKDHSHQHG